MKNAMRAAACAMLTLLLSPAANAADYVLKVSSPTNNDPILKWMETFEQKLESSSDGAIDVQLFPANQLGQIPATVEGVAMGTIEVTAPASGFFVQLDPRFEVLSVPGVFDDMSQAQRVLQDPEVLDRLATYGQDQGIETIAAFPHGPLALLSTKGVSKVADLEGQRIRVAGPTALNTGPFSRLGASPVSMPLGEVLPAMQNGVVDGLIAGMPVYVLGRYYDVATDMTMLPESYLIVTAVASQAFLDRIGDDLAAKVRAAAREALPATNEWSLQMADRMADMWAEKGGTVIELPEDQAQAYLDAVADTMPEALSANPELGQELEFFRAATARLADN
ncbi:TRAP transporter substrate-binding protein [Amorphus sp. 3PC139-8]|uniref:TRAP transporter substrate-binding protein n=1 Tax=Amorphus sp. 3PC139-8 TaxID=2735676 RepID=UPI00345D1462